VVEVAAVEPDAQIQRRLARCRCLSTDIQTRWLRFEAKLSISTAAA
jgi:hypothetical protein